MCRAYRNLVSRFLLALSAIMFVGVGVAQAGTSRCTVKDVMVYANRIHVQCTTTTLDGSSNIRYFAVSAADAKLADRLLTIGTTALVSGRRFIGGFTNGDVSGTSFNCSAGDCRKLTSFGIE